MQIMRFELSVLACFPLAAVPQSQGHAPGGAPVPAPRRRRAGSSGSRHGCGRDRSSLCSRATRAEWASPATPLAHPEWEIKPLGVPFDGAGIARGDVDESLVTAGGKVTFDELAAASLVPPKLRDAKNTPYHWRARVATNNPLFPHTAWFTSPSFELRKPALHP